MNASIKITNVQQRIHTVKTLWGHMNAFSMKDSPCTTTRAWTLTNAIIALLISVILKLNVAIKINENQKNLDGSIKYRKNKIIYIYSFPIRNKTNHQSQPGREI